MVMTIKVIKNNNDMTMDDDITNNNKKSIFTLSIHIIVAMIMMI